MRAGALAPLGLLLALGLAGCLEFSVEDYCAQYPSDCAPRIDAVLPSEGPTTGGISVRLVGAGITDDVQVELGGVPVRITGHWGTELAFELPPGAPGERDIVLRQEGSVLTLPAAFRYQAPPEPPPPEVGPPPQVHSMEPTVGSTLGGSPVQLRGVHFTEDLVVTFGGRAVRPEAAPQGPAQQEQRITVRAPHGARGRVVDVEVHTRFGVARVPGGFRYEAPWEASAAGLGEGDVQALLVPSGHGQTVLAADAQGGLLRSTDGGRVWRRLEGEPTGVVVHVLLEDASTGTLYAGSSRGVLRSTDGGGTWRAWNEGFLSPGPPEVDDLFLSGGSLYLAAQEGVARRPLVGEGWRFLTTSSQERTPQGARCVAVTATGVYAGTGQGVTLLRPGEGAWRKVGEPIAVDALRVQAGAGQDDILVGTGAGLHRLHAESGTWGALLEGRAVHGLQQTAAGQWWLLTSSGLLRAEAAEGPWSEVTALPALDVAALALDGEGRLLVGSRGLGVWVGPVEGPLVPSNEGLRVGAVQALVVDPAMPSRLLALSPNGVYRSEDAGRQWALQQVLQSEGPWRLLADPHRPGRFYLQAGSGLWRSDDAGGAWHALAPEHPVRDIALSPLLSDTLYVTATDGIWRSGDAGDSWQAIGAGFPDASDTSPAPTRGQALVASAWEPDTLYASWTQGPGLFVLREAVGWREVEGVAVAALPSLLQVEAQAGVMLAAGGGRAVLLKPSAPGVSTALPVHPLVGQGRHVAAFASSSTPRLLLVQVLGPVRLDFQEGAEGLLLEPPRSLSDGLPFSSVTSLAVDPTDPLRLYVGTLTAGVARSTIGGL